MANTPTRARMQQPLEVLEIASEVVRRADDLAERLSTFADRLIGPVPQNTLIPVGAGAPPLGEHVFGQLEESLRTTIGRLCRASEVLDRLHDSCLDSRNGNGATNQSRTGIEEIQRDMAQDIRRYPHHPGELR